MSLDLRIPLGLMFTIVGAIMGVFGFFTRGSAIYQRSADLNINLIWGLVMLVFGLAMLFLGLRASKRAHSRPVKGTAGPLGH
jgi:sulfite exporter TauE/SafE